MNLITMQQAEAILKKKGLYVFAQYRMNDELNERMFHVQVCGITRQDMVESITATLEDGIRYAVQQYTGGAA